MKDFKNFLGYMTIAMIVFGFVQCKDETEEPTFTLLEFSNDRSAFENSSNASFEFQVEMNEVSDQTVSVDFATEDLTAIAGEDYENTTGTLTIPAGQSSGTFTVDIIIDEFLEDDEQFKVKLSNPINAFLKGNIQEAIGTIKNDDSVIQITDQGYTTPDNYPGMTLVWSDEFDGTDINTNNWTHELGANGWGNNELQNYTANADNSYLNDGNLIIVANEVGSGQYTSARMITKDKQEFQYGRIDIRALLPVDEGMWPALWMLGANFSDVGWPACGEMDIMELVGLNPRRVHAAAHFGANNAVHQYTSNGISIPFPDTFADEFHVFSLIWTENQLEYYMDDMLYHTVTPADLNGADWPFNAPAFFIFNIAVGGDWPGSPTENTTFPEVMAVDYVRVFQ